MDARITPCVVRDCSVAWACLRSRRLAQPRRGLGAQSVDLAPRQGNADLADPLQLHAVDRFGIETREVDERGRLAAFDRFQIALARLQAHDGLLAVKACQRMALLA